MTALHRELRDALMALIQESIAAADWKKGIWETNTWSFDIVEGATRYKYRLYSVPAHDGQGFGPYVPDPETEFFGGDLQAGNLMISASYSTPVGGQIRSHIDVVIPLPGFNVNKWVTDFIATAKRQDL